MKFKSIIACVALMSLLIPSGMVFAASNKSSVPASFVYQAISKYKNRNYTGCIQDLDYAISHGRSSDIAYYYKALSYARLGMRDEAKTAYQSAYDITSNSILAEYAKEAIACIDEPTSCGSGGADDISTFIKSKEFLHQDVKEVLKQQAIERSKNNINNDANPGNDNLKYINYNNNAMPTDKEIADAVRTFQRLGMNPFSGVNTNMAYGQNNELMQLNALFNNQNNNNNNMMNLVPMLSALQAQGGSATSNKDIMQAYMLNQMLPNFNFGNNDK